MLLTNNNNVAYRDSQRYLQKSQRHVQTNQNVNYKQSQRYLHTITMLLTDNHNVTYRHSQRYVQTITTSRANKSKRQLQTIDLQTITMLLTDTHNVTYRQSQRYVQTLTTLCTINQNVTYNHNVTYKQSRSICTSAAIENYQNHKSKMVTFDKTYLLVHHVFPNSDKDVYFNSINIM